MAADPDHATRLEGLAPVEVALATGWKTTFDVEFGRSGPAVFLLSVRKCGSSLLNQLGRALARANGRNYIAPSDQFFLENLRVRDYIADPALANILQPGNAYGGFRDMPVAFLGQPLFDDGPKILLIRDPRDALVSQFFSIANSHRIPDAAPESDGVAALLESSRREAREWDIDTWVLSRARDMATTMSAYFTILGSPTLTVVRYEDYIFEKRALISLIVTLFGWEADDELVGHMLGWADVRPEQEDPTAHIRKVTPGDHLEKLRPETIASLDEILREPLERFGYARA